MIDTDLPDDPCKWIIVYADAEMPDESFSGADATNAAHRRFEMVKVRWNCSLFVRVAVG